MAGKRKTVDSCVESWLEILPRYIDPLQDAPFFSLNSILYLLGYLASGQKATLIIDKQAPQ